ncbi:TPA: hypothetical protein ENS27_12215 [bacterium]|nr:hypothetical protein [bacterium]
MAKIEGAGGSSGGILTFFLGLTMTIVGSFLFMNHVKVGTFTLWFFGRYNWGPFNRWGVVLIPLLFGIGFLFFNAKSIIGWILTITGALIIFISIITSISFHFPQTSLFNLIIMLVLLIGGIGLMLRSFRAVK